MNSDKPKCHPVVVLTTEALGSLIYRAYEIAAFSDAHDESQVLYASLMQTCMEFAEALMDVNEAYRQGKSEDLVAFLDDFLALTTDPQAFSPNRALELAHQVQKLQRRAAILRGDIDKILICGEENESGVIDKVKMMKRTKSNRS